MKNVKVIVDMIDVLDSQNCKSPYISGPMTGIDNLNREAFDKVETYLLSYGIHPFNPVSTNRLLGNDATYNEYLGEDLKYLLKCDSIIMLKGWGNSKGAKVEHAVATAIGIPIIYMEAFNALEA